MAAGWITNSARQAIYDRDKMTCAYCGKRCKAASVKGMTTREQADYMRQHAKDFATLDHIIPRATLALVYGSESFLNMLVNPRNLVTVCNGCNSSKKNTDLKTWCNRKGYSYRNVMRRIARRVNKTA